MINLCKISQKFQTKFWKKTLGLMYIRIQQSLGFIYIRIRWSLELIYFRLKQDLGLIYIRIKQSLGLIYTKNPSQMAALKMMHNGKAEISSKQCTPNPSQSISKCLENEHSAKQCTKNPANFISKTWKTESFCTRVYAKSS